MTSKLKSICFVVATPFTANAFLLGHIKKLSEFFNVTLCVNLKLYPLSPEFDLKKINVINIPMERNINLAKDLSCLFSLYQLFSREQFDVVHTVSPKAGLLGVLAAFFARIENRFHTFTGQIWANSQGFSRVFYKVIDRLICCLATAVFADSQSQIDYLVAERICSKNAISILGFGSISGVNLERFKSDESVRHEYRNLMGAAEGDIVFLFVGRLCQDKGVGDLLLAFKESYLQIGGGQFLWLVGPDEENMQHILKPIYSELNNQIRWIGPSFEPEKYMAAADILVLPSYREGFGNVVIEAAACNMPAIAYRTEGVIDAISDGYTGLLVPKYDVKGLSKSMNLVASDFDLRQLLGDNAYVRVKRLFSSEIVTEKWLSFYKKLLNNEDV